MKFENRQPAEGINAPPEHPLKEFTQLIIAVSLIGIFLIGSLTYFAGRLVHHIPFRYEQNMTANLTWIDALSSNGSQSADQPGSEQKSSVQQRLQILLEQLIPNMDLPEEMQITVHYSEDNTVNAFASIGGHVVFFKGLVDQIPSDQALAAVLAHEIAHIKLRHPIIAAGRGVTLLTLGAVISGASSSAAGEWLIGRSVNFQMMQFSRKQELAADRLAAEALIATYGNAEGLYEVFDLFEKLEANSLLTSLSVEALRSHPYSRDRLSAIKAITAKQD